MLTNIGQPVVIPPIQFTIVSPPIHSIVIPPIQFILALQVHARARPEAAPPARQRRGSSEGFRGVGRAPARGSASLAAAHSGTE